MMEVFEITRDSQRENSLDHRRRKWPFLLYVVSLILLSSVGLVLMQLLITHKKVSEDLAVIQHSQAGFNVLGWSDAIVSSDCEYDYCTSEECITKASQMMDWMQPSVDPCEDFYEFACGGFPTEEGNAYQIVQNSIDRDLIKMLEKQDTDSDSRTLKKLRQFYNSCMNSTQRNTTEKETLRTFFFELGLRQDDVLENTLDGSPLLWQQVISALEGFQLHTIFKPIFHLSEHNTLDRIELDCNIPFLEPSIYWNLEGDGNSLLLSLYKATMDALLESWEDDPAVRREIIEDVIRLEADIAEAIRADRQNEKTDLSPDDVQQLKEIWRPLTGDGIQELNLISVCQYNLQHIMSVLNSAPNRQVIRYLQWRTTLQLSGHISTLSGRRLLGQLPRHTRPEEQPWIECAGAVRAQLGLAAAGMLLESGAIDRHLQTKLKTAFEELKETSWHAFKHVEALWADNATKAFLIDKMRNMKLDMGFPTFMDSPEVMDELYDKLTFGNNFLRNFLDLKKFKRKHFFNLLWYGNSDDPKSLVSLEKNPLDAYSFYDYTSNTVTINLGLVRSPMFQLSENIPKYLRHGDLWLLAKRMSAAMDSKGRFYNSDGSRVKNSLLPQTISGNFPCDVPSLSNETFAADEKNVNVFNDLITDAESLFITYEGMFNDLKNFKSEKPLPGIPLTKKQTYFVQIAQKYCDAQIATDPEQSPTTKVKMNMMISNTKDFSEIFHCGMDSSMHSSNKCTVNEYFQ